MTIDETHEPGTPGSDLDDAGVAALMAVTTGETLLRVRGEGLAGRELKDAGDAAAQRVLAEGLARLRPRDVVLSEEAPDPELRLGADRVWIVDPLDGTREFSEPGRDDWAVHVALWEKGELVAGAIATPATGEVFRTDEPPVRPAVPAGTVRIAVSRTRPPAFVVEMARDLGAELVPMGSAGVKCASVWRGQAEAYVHAGGQYQWDSAAPVAVARAAGLHTSRIDGSPLVYNGPDLRLPDLVVSTPEVSGPVLEWIAARGGRLEER